MSALRVLLLILPLILAQSYKAGCVESFNLDVSVSSVVTFSDCIFGFFLYESLPDTIIYGCSCLLDAVGEQRRDRNGVGI